MPNVQCPMTTGASPIGDASLRDAPRTRTSRLCRRQVLLLSETKANNVRDLPSPSKTLRERVTLLRRSPWSPLLPKGEASAKGEESNSWRPRRTLTPLRIERQSAQRGEPAHAAGSGTGNRARGLTATHCLPNAECPMPNALKIKDIIKNQQ